MLLQHVCISGGLGFVDSTANGALQVFKVHIIGHVLGSVMSIAVGEVNNVNAALEASHRSVGMPGQSESLV